MRNSIKSGMAPGAVWIVVAAYNEAPALGRTLSGLLASQPNVVVVDDASTDGTPDVARALPVHLLRHRVNLGQGAALRTGMDYALLKGAAVVVTFDADGQMDPADLPALCRPVLEGEADLALGSRFLGARAQNLPAVRGFFLRAAAFFYSRLTGLSLTDAHNGLRAFSRDAAARVEIVHGRMAHASEIIHQAAALRLRVVEVPVTIRYSEYSLAKGQSLLRMFDIFWDLIFHQPRRPS